MPGIVSLSLLHSPPRSTAPDLSRKISSSGLIKSKPNSNSADITTLDLGAPASNPSRNPSSFELEKVGGWVKNPLARVLIAERSSFDVDEIVSLSDEKLAIEDSTCLDSPRGSETDSGSEHCSLDSIPDSPHSTMSLADGALLSTSHISSADSISSVDAEDVWLTQLGGLLSEESDVATPKLAESNRPFTFLSELFKEELPPDDLPEIKHVLVTSSGPVSTKPTQMLVQHLSSLDYLNAVLPRPKQPLFEVILERRFGTTNIDSICRKIEEMAHAVKDVKIESYFNMYRQTSFVDEHIAFFSELKQEIDRCDIAQTYRLRRLGVRRPLSAEEKSKRADVLTRLVGAISVAQLRLEIAETEAYYRFGKCEWGARDYRHPAGSSILFDLYQFTGSALFKPSEARSIAILKELRSIFRPEDFFHPNSSLSSLSLQLKFMSAAERRALYVGFSQLHIPKFPSDEERFGKGAISGITVMFLLYKYATACGFESGVVDYQEAVKSLNHIMLSTDVPREQIRRLAFLDRHIIDAAGVYSYKFERPLESLNRLALIDTDTRFWILELYQKYPSDLIEKSLNRLATLSKKDLWNLGAVSVAIPVAKQAEFFDIMFSFSQAGDISKFLDILCNYKHIKDPIVETHIKSIIDTPFPDFSFLWRAVPFFSKFPDSSDRLKLIAASKKMPCRSDLIARSDDLLYRIWKLVDQKLVRKDAFVGWHISQKRYGLKDIVIGLEKMLPGVKNKEYRIRLYFLVGQLKACSRVLDTDLFNLEDATSSALEAGAIRLDSTKSADEFIRRVSSALESELDGLSKKQDIRFNLTNLGAHHIYRTSYRS